MWFIEFILLTIICLYLLGWIGKKLLGWWLARKQRQFADKFGQGGGFTYSWSNKYDTGKTNNQEQRNKEGEIHIQQTQIIQKKVSRNVGDYVEYEEIIETNYEQKR